MSEKPETGRDIERRRSHDPRPSEHARPARTGEGDGASESPVRADDSRDRGTLADAVAQTAVRSARVETESVAATLVGVPEIELRDFAYAHQLPEGGTDETRPVALFDLENRTDRPIRWRSARTKFVGDDRYTYQPAHVALEPSRLGPGCHTRQVEIEPGSRARMMTMVERLPEGVEIAKVVQTVVRRGRTENERLVFSLE